METIALTVPDACRAIGIGKTTAYKLIKDGKLEQIKVGARTLIVAESVRHLIDSLKNAG